MIDLKFLQKLGILSLVIIISLAVSGCMGNNNNSKDINTQALEYMEKKYGEKFEYSAPYGNSMTGTHQLLVKCASFPNQDILVQIENYRKDNKIFSDNYLAVKYRNDTIEFIQKCANKQFGESKVFYNVAKDSLSPKLSANASFNEFLADTQVPLNFSIRTKASLFTSEKQAIQLAESLAVYGTHFDLVLASVKDQQYNNNKNDSNSDLNFVWRVQLTNLSGKIEIEWLRKE